jgi:diguanylate cyclase (GGDEF)-like protein
MNQSTPVMTLEDILIDCVRILATESDMDMAVNQFLLYIRRFYCANRAYIFEFDSKRQIIRNTYECCAPGVTAEIDHLQAVPMKYIAAWIHKFHEEGEFLLKALEDHYEPDSEAYKILYDQNIKSLMATPLIQNNEIVGFLGVDDPQNHLDNLTLLKVSAYFCIEEMVKRRLIERLKVASYTDLLTGLKNRNQYTTRLAEYQKQPPKALGVIFIDVNGMKYMNDTYGHNYGDQILVRTAHIIQDTVHTPVYRIGGDEFIVLYENIEEILFSNLVTDLRQRFSEDRECNVSIGDSWSTGQINVDELVAQADERMYLDKQAYYKAHPKPHTR